MVEINLGNNVIVYVDKVIKQDDKYLIIFNGVETARVYYKCLTVYARLELKKLLEKKE